ncbi:MAG TPA: ATP-binding protein [Vicinamibacteria bacterium]|nr:ATP-binding protein [Vicinamibacteria bacterium]
MKASPAALLRRLADEVLEAADVEGLTRLLTRKLPSILNVEGATLLLWDRKLDTFEGLTPHETQAHPVWPGGPEVQAPQTRYLVVEGALVETPQKEGSGTLLPLLARSGLAGSLVLGRRKGRRVEVFRPAEVKWLSVIASRAALALENSFYLKELVATERVAALGTMASMLAHDFRGPMTVIRGYAETLLDPTGLSGEEIKARAELIVSNVDRLERMTTETLDFARIGSRLTRRSVPLGLFVQDLAAGLAAELPGIEVVPHFELQGAPRGALDVDKVRRAASNIAQNARDAMQGRGRIHLTAGLDRGSLVLVLADEGPGVSEEVRARIFEPFVTHGKKKGTGLGLAVARRFVEDHGGRVELLKTPLPPATGAAFRMVLPLGDPADARVPE